jgi:uncharacterized Zn finger protein (UPF0148 family)
MEVDVAGNAEKSKVRTPPQDIVFDCPHCNKSLSIDQRGAGLLIVCPECEADVQVPGVPLAERNAEAEKAAAAPAVSEALASAHAKIERLVASLEEVRERRRYLEKVRTDNMARYELISKDLVTIQNAVDRIVAIIQDATAEKPAEDKA